MLGGWSSCKPADRIAPEFRFSNAWPAFIPLGDSIAEPDIQVIDNRECDLREAVVVDGFVHTDRYGDYRIDYRVSDAAGNSSDTGFDVRVGMIPRNYFAVEYRAIDTCDSGVFEYLAGIQDCTCPEDRVLLFNLGNFGPGHYVNLRLSGDYGHVLNLDREQGALTWSGSGMTLPYGDTLRLNWQVDNGANTENCRTQMVRNNTP